MTLPAFLIPMMPAVSEIMLAALSLVVVVVGGVVTRQSAMKFWSLVVMAALAGAVATGFYYYQEPVQAFGGLFVQDNLALAFKTLIAGGAIAGLLLSWPYFSNRHENKFEYPLLVMLASIGMFGMVSAYDFLSFYVSLELQSLSLYVLASFRRDHKLNSEAGLKYFFLGALSSGILLYGISLLYGFAGTTSYAALATTLSEQGATSPGIVVALVLVLAGVAFKISAAPFHMWTPDVYQGASLPVTAFFSMAPKAAAMGALVRLVTGPFAPVFDQAQQIIVLLCVASLFVGAFAAIAQTNLKRLMAYSSIGHVGFILLGLTSNNAGAIQAVLFYTIVYVIMSAGSFAVMMAVYDHVEEDEQVVHLAGLSKRAPVLAASLAALLFSMAGIPPFVGFFAKLLVIKGALIGGLAWLAVLAIVLSVVSAYYYIRLIKIMYFDAPAKNAPAVSTSRLWAALAVLSAVLTIAMLVYPLTGSDMLAWATANLQ